jgi:hypothetical protein
MAILTNNLLISLPKTFGRWGRCTNICRCQVLFSFWPIPSDVWGGEKNQYGDNLYKHNGFPPIKIKIPAAVRGPEPVAKTRAEYKPLLEKIVADAEQLIVPVTDDLGEYKCIQPAFGWLNAHEWYHLMEMHFRHHLRQRAELETLMSPNL